MSGLRQSILRTQKGDAIRGASGSFPAWAEVGQVEVIAAQGYGEKELGASVLTCAKKCDFKTVSLSGDELLPH